ncbi:uncharacterized protein H6S33_009006 [Morchella sextelata]|uniref:uncharacterized protein n=1 Tax=Morchella sextelata TaxID=1174677 RepID=UPI001D05AA70|nr:uncharacterized protein H6S33_009006 [Morchella sextelata]KAH0612626.1 hypothetical protein H6S33_009006 [Morchella sextelata]
MTLPLKLLQRRGAGGALSLPRGRQCRNLQTSASPAQNRVDRPFRLAVIGAGPAGFYTAYRVLSKLYNAKVDMYESLPVPYGLVRFGVAPDHPEVKNCQDKFNEVAQDPRFTYIGNLPIGTSWPHPPHRSLPLTTLAPHYDALLLSYGASKDRELGIPGENSLSGVFSARAFVGWYNGLPEYRSLNPRLDSFGDEAVIIGQGNVALDVARILVMNLEELRKTDITEYALEALGRSRVRRVRVVGRRGPLQASFTVKELRELLSLPGVGFPPVNPELLPTDTAGLQRAPKRMLQVLQKGPRTALETASKSWELGFLRSPKAFLPSVADPTRLGAVLFDKMQLEEPFSPTSRVTQTGETETIQTGLAFRSIGYLSEPIPGFEELDIPFNGARGLVPNEDGRVVHPLDPATGEPGVPVPGVYTSGWVKRGPTGVIATTMYDAFDTGDVMVSDWVAGEKEFLQFGGLEKRAGWDALKGEVGRLELRPINWEQWRKIDEAEKERGRKMGKEREKFASEEEMLSVLD